MTLKQQTGFEKRSKSFGKGQLLTIQPSLKSQKVALSSVTLSGILAAYWRTLCSWDH